MANHFTSDSNLHNILPQSQFGSRPYHLVTNACTLLRYKANTTINSRHIGGTLLFDISCFFDHLDPNFTARVLHHLGINDHTIGWVKDFMTHHEVTMSFNNFITNPLQPKLGTPQGSPLSPILSALVTRPILHLAESWEDTDLTLYVNDGNIFASRPTYNSTVAKLSQVAQHFFSWLKKSGFLIDKDKYEVMFFHPRVTRTSSIKYGTAPSAITLQLPDNSHISIKLTTSIQYLGVFFTP